ncbi:MAG: hypothetical protein LBJ93_03545 [Clostridiales bacterium]|jgi:stage III sporulation protein AG|nr:hypothetical protein [Clostridiales bacterium]
MFLILSKPSKKQVYDKKNILNDKTLDTSINSDRYDQILERRLENLLSNVNGVGKINVMITLANSKEIVIAQDTNVHEIYKNEDIREIKQESKKILLENKTPIILKEIEPIIQGVVIVTEGADNINVKSELIKSIQALLNLEAHKIKILKKN